MQLAINNVHVHVLIHVHVHCTCTLYITTLILFQPLNLTFLYNVTP